MVAMLEDKMPLVRFGKVARENRTKTIEQGRLITEDVDMVYVKQIGEKDEVELEAKKWLEQQRALAYGMNGREPTLPESWFERYEKAYNNYLKGFANQPDGFPVREWAILTPAQVQNMHSMETYTVEQVAGWTETAIAKFGLGGRELKEKAKLWLASGDQKAEQIAAQQVEIQGLKDTVEKLMSAIKEMQEADSEDEDKPRRGRPPKQ